MRISTQLEMMSSFDFSWFNPDFICDGIFHQVQVVAFTNGNDGLLGRYAFPAQGDNPFPTFISREYGFHLWVDFDWQFSTVDQFVKNCVQRHIAEPEGGGAIGQVKRIGASYV